MVGVIGILPVYFMVETLLMSFESIRFQLPESNQQQLQSFRVTFSDNECFKVLPHKTQYFSLKYVTSPSSIQFPFTLFRKTLMQENGTNGWYVVVQREKRTKREKNIQNINNPVNFKHLYYTSKKKTIFLYCLLQN